MSDPAVEAARRVTTEMSEFPLALDAAREALKPISELVERVSQFRISPVSDLGLLLSDLRALVYSSEELS